MKFHTCDVDAVLLQLNRPTIQKEILQAFQQEPELRDMMESLSSKQVVVYHLDRSSQRHPNISQLAIVL